MSGFKISIVGAGRMGTALAALLAQDAGFRVRVLDRSEDALDGLRHATAPLETRLLCHGEELHTVLAGEDLVVAAVPDSAVAAVAEAARRARVHYLDFIATPAAARQPLEELAATRAVLPGCGVSPGLAGTLACALLKRYAPVSDLIIRVGALPRYPANRLGYGQIWHVDGLIDEYTRPCTALREGRSTELSPLEDYERVNIDGVAFEAFTTSGGLGDLDAVARFSPRSVTFKTLRYPGHLDYMRFLLDDLGLRQRRDMLKSLLCNGLPVVEDDVLHVMLTVKAMRGRQPVERTQCLRFGPPHSPLHGPAGFGTGGGNGGGNGGGAGREAVNALTATATAYAATLISGLAGGKLAATGMLDPASLDVDAMLTGPYLAPLLNGSAAAPY
ncbi:saccharopine dehydrogenase family protein [Pannonibacter phragmitetus]|uniref:saccharopine dehydrogenase family protein n=1 Tax=Pannonibacter phragmitetus TaxID=121719 RepID=UPI000F45EE15|nr:saccharopine dehydrogenase C-terminal domain-containing protein [Pannonibacter phragmitetus]